MGQSINVLLYGVRVPDGVNTLRHVLAKWEDHVSGKVETYREKLDAKTGGYNWNRARDAYMPSCPRPDDADPDDLVGFYVSNGDDDDYSAHDFPAMTFAEMRTTKPTAKIIKRCRRRWSRFARWARTQGVELGKPRIWRTRTEVA